MTDIATVNCPAAGRDRTRIAIVKDVHEAACWMMECVHSGPICGLQYVPSLHFIKESGATAIATVTCPAAASCCTGLGVLEVVHGRVCNIMECVTQDGSAVFSTSFHFIKESSVFSRHLERGLTAKNRSGKSKGSSPNDIFQGKFTWKIEHFTRLKELLKKRKITGLCIKSKRFQVGGRDCRLIVYPRGNALAHHPPPLGTRTHTWQCSATPASQDHRAVHQEQAVPGRQPGLPVDHPPLR